MTPRTVDHFVLAYPTLGEARSAFTALGFLVAPDAAHPFGTGNACVFLADGTYLEPLAVLDGDAARAASEDGNAFAAHALEVEPTAPAVSGLALVSANAPADRDGFAARGLGGADLVAFSRPFRDAEWQERTLSFRLAFARIDSLDRTLVLTCERLGDTAPDRTAFTRHPNRVAGLARLVFAGEGEAARGILSNLLGGTPEALAPPAELLTPGEIARRYGATVDVAAGGLRLAGLVLRGGDPTMLQPLVEDRLLSASAGGLVHALAGGGFLAFEAVVRD